jgi:uncharacterized Fe-S cluster-containing radical SAM superfamily protein
MNKQAKYVIIGIPISKLGKYQIKDIENSTGIVYHNGIARICTVIKDSGSPDNRNDDSPYRMAKLFGGSWQDYNHHFIIQVAGCPLRCWYCYVDNLKKDLIMSADEMVKMFINFRKEAKKKFNIDLNVFHLMGGAPALYYWFWPILREALDNRGLNNVILFSDIILVENYFYSHITPWNYMEIPNFIVTGCLKGTNRSNFLQNTGFDLFDQAVKELKHYIRFKNFYLTLIGYDEEDLPEIYDLVGKERVNLLKIIEYEVVKRRHLKTQEE